MPDGVWDVVELEVEKDRHSMFGDAKHAFMSVGAEEFETKLHAASDAANFAGYRRRPVNVGRIERDEDRRHAARLSFGRFRHRLRRHGGKPIAVERFDAAIERPDARAQNQPGRKPTEQEGDQQQDRNLDVRLNVAPQVERRVRPIGFGEQGDDHRDQHPENGLEKMHRGPFRRAVRSTPATGSSRIRVGLSQAR